MSSICGIRRRKFPTGKNSTCFERWIVTTEWEWTFRKRKHKSQIVKVNNKVIKIKYTKNLWYTIPHKGKNKYSFINGHTLMSSLIYTRAHTWKSETRQIFPPSNFKEVRYKGYNFTEWYMWWRTQTRIRRWVVVVSLRM